jgi:hypothetical protein
MRSQCTALSQTTVGRRRVRGGRWLGCDFDTSAAGQPDRQAIDRRVECTEMLGRGRAARTRHSQKIIKGRCTDPIAQRTDAISAILTTEPGVCLRCGERKSFSSAMLQRILQRSTAGRPQLRGLTKTGEQCTPHTAVRPRWRRRVQLLSTLLSVRSGRRWQVDPQKRAVQ